MPKFPFKSLRDWIDFLKDQGELVENNEEVDLQGEVAAISRKIALTGGPAVLHNNIKGYPGWRLFSDGLATRKRTALALGMREGELVTKLIEKLKGGKLEKVKPIVVDHGPCKELRFFEGELDLSKVPVAFTAEYDSPPFITAGISNVRDPDTGWMNTGIRRFQLKGKDRLNNLILPFQHEGIIFSKYMKKGQLAPIAIVVGADPIYYLISQMPAPEQVDEVDNWGGFAGCPLEVVKCETSDLVVPATAEIIIEGEILPDERSLEGPFSEFTGFYSGLRKLPIIRVTCITMRKDPIYQNMYITVPTSEPHCGLGLMLEIELLSQLKALIPEVADVASTASGALTTVIAVNKAARTRNPGLVKKVSLAVKAVQAGTWVKNVIIVDDDTDPHNIDEVIWCLSVKFQGQKDILVIPDMPGTFLDPSEPYLGKGPGTSSYTVFDCTEKPAPYNEAYKRGLGQPDEKYRKMVEEKWTKYGFSR